MWTTIRAKGQKDCKPWNNIFGNYRICGRCSAPLPKDYPTKTCENCKAYGKNWRKENKKLVKEYLKKNKESIRKYQKKYLKKWRIDNIKHWRKWNREYFNKKRKLDSKFGLDMNMANAIGLALKGKKRMRKWQDLVDYTFKDLIKHLENQFDDKMNWGNYGSYWWVDHIKARSLFKYETAEDLEFKKCWALSNLQPLEKISNIKKSNYL